MVVHSFYLKHSPWHRLGILTSHTIVILDQKAESTAFVGFGQSEGTKVIGSSDVMALR